MLKIGWATRDVSTDKPVPITGQAYIRVNEGVLDPTTSTALVLDDGQDCVIFVSLDIVAVRCGLLDEVRAKVKAKKPEIPVEKILMNATHTHTGPSHYHLKGLLTAGPEPENQPDINYDIADPDEFRAWLGDVMTDMIIEAWDKRAPGAAAYGYGYAVVAHSRRVCYFDDTSKRGPKKSKTDTFGVNGTAIMYGNTNDDNFSHYEAGADHFINLFYTFDAEGKLTGAIINVPCPSQNTEGMWQLSADYWHDVRVAIKERFGDIFILPQCASAGDLSPRILHYKQAQSRRFALKYGVDAEAANRSNEIELAARKDIAERIADAFGEVLSWAKKDLRTEMKISHKVSTVNLSEYVITDEDYAYCKEGLEESMKVPFVYTDDHKADLIANTRILSNRKRFQGIIKRYEKQKTNKTHPMEMHVLRVGDIAFASNQFELYMDFQHRMQARSPFEQTFVVQLSAQPGEEAGSYLCTERALAGRGYSAIMFSIRVSPQGGQELVEETVKQLKELYAEE